jgi:hypothetical protein
MLYIEIRYVMSEAVNIWHCFFTGFSNTTCYEAVKQMLTGHCSSHLKRVCSEDDRYHTCPI